MSASLRQPATARPIASPVTSVAANRLGIEAKIDLCRGAFAILVVVAHALEVTSAVHPELEAGAPKARLNLLRNTAGAGFYWVMGFFVISGYCIHLSVARLGRDGKFPLGPYLAARLSRILPLYYLALVFTALVEWLIAGARPTNWGHGIDARTFAMQVLGVQNLSQTFGSFAPSWSITNELFYYVIYGLLASSLIGRRGGAAWVGIGSCAAVGAGMLGLYVLAPGRGVILSLGLLFGLGINWFLGVLVAVYRRELAASPRWGAIARFWPLVLAGAIAGRVDGRLRLEFVYLTSGVAFALMMVRFAASDRGREGPSGAIPEPIRLLGLSSYPMYLFHGPILMLLGSAILRWKLSLGWQATWLLMTVVAVAAGLALGVLVEAPLMAWRAGWLRGIRESRGGTA